MCYIPVLQLLSNLLSSPDILESVMQPIEKSEVLQDITDRDFISQHLQQVDSGTPAILLLLYSDELELSNPPEFLASWLKALVLRMKSSSGWLLFSVYFSLFLDSALLTAVVFALGETFPVLFLARAIQGVGSSCITVADDSRRSKVMGFTLGGAALGVLAGYPYGGVLYDFVGKTTPFVVLASFSIVLSVLCALLALPTHEETIPEATSMLYLVVPHFVLGLAIGPGVSGYLVKAIGFPWVMRSVAMLNLLYCPLLLLLRNPQLEEEKNALVMNRPASSNYEAVKAAGGAYTRFNGETEDE
ncbi:hypothetical protein HPB47_013823 [Ixodes persulcatus]|uniref:Uncharacterized protein n=1 Tax=Ixodes persulcatus TaxID=34615 RepID=A0AC60QXV1_IXOPE|nr:hypothetical protein HPB47_013823 [Ixodes persulcatus]